jgi:glycine/D-amino acid oxidase-like deaminating enzyme
VSQGADVVIIGGGCAGSSIAYHLARARAGRVLLLERRSLASGTTGFSSAIVRQHYSTPVLAAMAQRSLRRFQHFAEEIGGEAGFRQTGMIMGAREQDLAALRTAVAMQQSLGIDTRMIDLAELHALEPRLSARDLVAACYETEAGYADPVATTTSFGRRARELGAQIREQSAVLSLRVESGRIRGVRLIDGTAIDADAVVVAANVWSVALLRDIGIDVPVRPSRHACILVQQPPSFGAQHAIFVDFSHGLYLRPEGADLTLIGTIDEPEQPHTLDPDSYRATPTPDEEARMAGGVANRFPILQHATLHAGWAGIYDVSADWQPLLGRVPGILGLYCACGFSGHGFKLSPMVGELMANLVLEQDTADIDLDFFRIDRFVRGTSARGQYAYGILG